MSKTSALPLSQMDMKSRENLERILGLQPHELTRQDRAFMRGRADYLTAEQKKDYVTNQPEDVAEVQEDDSYDDWTVAELKEELKARDLAVGGTKRELVARLEADDEA